MAKIYQLYYTRLGKQGSNAGWQVAAASAGTPQLVKNTFYKLASNLVAIGARAQTPSQAFDLQMTENYVFFSHINYHSTNEGSETDIRGVSFIHGFVASAEDYRELVREPGQIFGIRNDAIELNYNGKRELPLLDKIPHQPFQKKELLDKYRLDQERFENLMYCIYAAIETVGGGLTIKSEECHGEEQKSLFLELVCLVMEYMPYILRMKINAFSGIRQGALLCFASELPEKGAWFDLDTGAYYCPQIPEYEFIQVFNDFNVEEKKRKSYYDKMEDFVNATFGGNYEALKLNHVELAFRGVFFTQDWLSSEEQLDGYIKEAASLRAFKYDWLDVYYARLIHCYLQKDRELPSLEVFKKLQKRFLDTECQELKEEFADYYITKICRPGEQSAYEMLYRLESVKPEKFAYLKMKLEETRPEFLDTYYADYYLEKQITDYDKLKEVCEKNKALPGKKLLEIMMRIFEKELAESDSNMQRYQICRKYTGLCRSFPKSRYSEVDACVHIFQEGYWKKFDEREFTYKNLKEYEEMGAKRRGNFPIPEKISRLLDARNRFMQDPDARDFQNVFFSDEVVQGEADRRRLVKELHAEAEMRRNLPLDSYLLLNYQQGKRFDLDHLARDLENSQKFRAGGDRLNMELASSKVLVSEAKRQFTEQLKEVAKSRNSHRLIQQLYKYYFPQMPQQEVEQYMLDLVRKCLMFLVIVLTYVVMVKYLLDENFTWGIIAAGIGSVASVAGFALSLVFGETNSLELFAKGDKRAILWMSIFTFLSAFAVGAAVTVSEVWMIYILAAAVMLLLVGRLFLR